MAKAKKTAVVKVDQDKATAAQLLEQYKVVVAAEQLQQSWYRLHWMELQRSMYLM